MLSRRNIRIKVMQMLYSQSRDKSLQYNELLKRYRQKINASYQLYLFNLLQLTRIAEYSKEDKARKTAKLLPSDEDRRFTAKLAENPLIRSLTHNEGLKTLFHHYQLPEMINEDDIRLLYLEFAKTEEYRAYLSNPKASDEDHREALLDLYKLCANSETFNDLQEDKFPQWVDDKSLIVGAMKKTIKALPMGPHFFEEYKPTYETTTEFGEALLREVSTTDEDLLQLIEPTLKNWDVDRVAIIDMILLKMALCELMNFRTIPSKVTLNEFVEISKLYSTDKSKDFINGILDRLMKKLVQEGKIKKEGRGLME